mmetsp:Transcript_78599/g.163335  ORF Transcript_78599/g.163335 Transcript_78599/m.163335 type:complete len:1239 (+) Transcript_78599:80-3796(+)|eukprot:CAMPEP_0206471112 /NCGR_PEP_ID=MMETSP0324_2-20121206/31355_1 /ASSEMBLY_ACC=CAM_ASM_000836 /TAXON_ID=2866 /ORGANISM="Crypthecodinium cohnii, Strain Seligo" /LENGTH=1238 /DNA_ID=CAMNT_0053945347 /DNA_START=30 /DNA_END=3746 /DNA_ORIENTATION=+
MLRPNPTTQNDVQVASQGDSAHVEDPDQPNNRVPPTLLARDGTEIHIHQLDLPPMVQNLLMELDIDGSGQVSEQNLEDTLRLMKHLKQGLDTDGSGGVTSEEMEAGIDLLTKLLSDQKNNSSEMSYKHMPQCIQDVFTEWDTDQSGKVGQAELAAAAKAFKKVQQEGRMMRRIIAVMAFVILLLMIGMFVLSYLAAEMAKEMRGEDDGTMMRGGTVVKVASSDMELAADGTMIIRGSNTTATCPEGQTCRRLGTASGSSSLKVAQAETARQLSSTLPDTAFKELKSLTLTDNSNHSLKVTINSFQRLSLRSSKCGSVVHLISPNGRLTLDDYEMTADEEMEAFVKEAGMGDLFAGGATSFGRRLSSTDGMLEGFFNLLDDVEWECTSVELPNPEDMPQYYRAKMKVRHLHEAPHNAYSMHFVDVDDNALPLAGIEIDDDGSVYKTWEEDLVRAGSFTAYLTRFGMSPFINELRIKSGHLQMRMSMMGAVGYHCRIEGQDPSTISQTADSPSMEFVGVVQEDGMVLRQWRMYTTPEETDENQESVLMNMIKAGMVPNVIDYYDVDTDPSGAFDSGLPYKIIMQSTVAGSSVYSEKKYLSIEALPAALNMEGVLDFMNVSYFDTECRIAKNLNESSEATEFLGEASFMGITNRSVVDADFEVPPEVKPWSEDAVEYHYDKLVTYNTREPTNEGYQRAIANDYWKKILKYGFNQDILEDLRYVYTEYNDTNSSVDLDNSTNSSDDDNGTNSSRRLGDFFPGEDEGTYRVRYDHALHAPQRRGKIPAHHEARRLAHERRLGGFSWELSRNPERVNLDVEIGDCKLAIVIHYCHLVDPLLTNWGACQTGRYGSGDVMKVEVDAGGESTVYPWPEVNLGFYGGIVYDDTAALGIDTDSKVLLRSLGARGKNLEDNSGGLRMLDSTGSRLQFTLVPVDANVGTEMRFWIRSYRWQYLSDGRGSLRWSSSNKGWEKWYVLDAGNGYVYLKSYHGNYLATQESSTIVAKECTVRIYRNYNCKGSYWTFTSTNPLGEEFKFKDDEWESARAYGDCSQVEFYDEDEGKAFYEDNQWKEGTFGCFDFKSDLDDDMDGLKIYASMPEIPEWQGSVTLSTTQNDAARWQLLKASDESSIISFGDPLVYGVVKFTKSISLMFGIGVQWTTELGVNPAYHKEHGVYIQEFYAKGILDLGDSGTNFYLLFKMLPKDPWYTKYRLYDYYVGFGYELDTWFCTYRDEFEIAKGKISL